MLLLRRGITGEHHTQLARSNGAATRRSRRDMPSVMQCRQSRMLAQRHEIEMFRGHFEDTFEVECQDTPSMPDASAQ